MKHSLTWQGHMIRHYITWEGHPIKYSLTRERPLIKHALTWGGGTSDKALFNLGGALNFHQTVSGTEARRLLIIKVFTSIRYCLPSIPVNINRFTWCHFQR